MKKVLFKETQQFRQWWYLVTLLGSIVPIMVFCVYALYQQTVKGIPIGNSPAPNGVLIILFFVLVIMLWGSLIMKLEVWINQDGMHYRFFPLILKNKFISKEEILRFEIRKYKPVLEYGGWGIRTGFGRKIGKAYNVNGSIGLQLYLKNGKKVLFGTQRPQAIMFAMDEIMNQKPKNKQS